MLELYCEIDIRGLNIVRIRRIFNGKEQRQHFEKALFSLQMQIIACILITIFVKMKRGLADELQV